MPAIITKGMPFIKQKNYDKNSGRFFMGSHSFFVLMLLPRCGFRRKSTVFRKIYHCRKYQKDLEIRFFSYYNRRVNKYDILQGRVKFPIGGKVRERYHAGFGAIPKPTV